MSRQNKVNPGMYTQRGRLTQDDAARELRKQREVGSQHTWQPVKKDQLPRFESKNENSDEGTETSEDTAPAADNVQPTKRMISKAKSSPKSKAKAAQPKAAKAAKKTAAKAKPAKAKTGKATGKAKTATAAKRGAKAKSAKPAKRQAILARNVGGNPKPRTAAKRRKS